MSILIPVANSDEVVEVQVSELPEDEGEVIDILQAELAPLDVWLRFAVEYYRQGRPESFEKMLEPLMELYRTEPNERNRLFEQFGSVDSVKRSFLAILNALAAFHTVKGSRERDKTKKKAEACASPYPSPGARPNSALARGCWSLTLR